MLPEEDPKADEVSYDTYISPLTDVFNRIICTGGKKVHANNKIPRHAIIFKQKYYASEDSMNSFCGILDIRNTDLNFTRLAEMRKGFGRSAEVNPTACIDRGVGILCVGTPTPLYTKATLHGELYIALDITNSETNVSIEQLAENYLSLGYGTPAELGGHFALAVFDRRKRELLLATDQLGAKPIFLHKSGERLIISTSIPALLRYSPACCEVDKAAVLALIRDEDGEIAPSDIFKNISVLPAGHFMIFSGLGAQTLKYTSKKESLPTPPSAAIEKDLTPQKNADLKKCAKIMTSSLGYPAFDTYTPEYIAAIHTASQEFADIRLSLKRHRLSKSYTYQQMYALGGSFGINVYLTESEKDSCFKKTFLADREKRLSTAASSILQNEHSHTRRLFGCSLETFVSKERRSAQKICILGKIIGLEHWLESYPITPI